MDGELLAPTTFALCAPLDITSINQTTRIRSTSILGTLKLQFISRKILREISWPGLRLRCLGRAGSGKQLLNRFVVSLRLIGALSAVESPNQSFPTLSHSKTRWHSSICSVPVLIRFVTGKLQSITKIRGWLISQIPPEAHELPLALTELL